MMDLARTTDRLFADWTGPDRPGAVVAVTQGGVPVHEAAYGMADIAHGVPLGRRSVLRIGSQTKQFTVLLALLLEEAGKLSMDDEVHRYAPWLAPLPYPVTLSHLAGNTGGLRDFLEVMIWSGLPLAAPSTRQTARDLLARHAEANFGPGEQMLYSNTGFFLLSEIIEEVSGRSYNELLAQHVTGPLGMEDTRLMPRDGDVLPRLAREHARDEDGASWRTVQWGFPLGGEGGMVSTLHDMLLWQSNLTKPLAAHARALARMEAPRRYRNGTETRYRLGLVSHAYRGLRSIGHGGTTAGAKSESMRFPDQGFGVVILGNTAELLPFPLARRIADAALAGHMAPPPSPDGMRRLADMAGLYRREGGAEVFEVTANDGVPGFTTAGGSVPFEQLGDDLFAPEMAVMHLMLRPTAAAGAADGFEADWCGASQRYRRLGTPTTKGRSIAGNYANPRLGLDARVGEDLMILLRSDVGAMRASLSPIDDDLFLLRAPDTAPRPGRPWLGTIQVSSDGLTLTTDRTKGLLLRRA